MRQTLRQADAADENLSYLSLSSGNPPSWSVGLEDVRIADRTWTADLQGLAVTHPGELPFAEGVAGRSLIRPVNFARAKAILAGHGTRIRRSASPPTASTRRCAATAARAPSTSTPRCARRRRIAGARVVGQRPGLGRPARRALPRAARIRAKAGISPARIDYAVISPPPPQVDLPTQWTIFFENVRERDRAWYASLDGSRVRPL